MSNRQLAMHEGGFLAPKDKLKLAKDEFLVKELEPGGRGG